MKLFLRDTILTFDTLKKFRKFSTFQKFLTINRKQSFALSSFLLQKKQQQKLNNKSRASGIKTNKIMKKIMKEKEGELFFWKETCKT